MMNGTGGSTNKSGMNLSPSYGNVYQIEYTFLGFGTVKFYVMSPNLNGFNLVHLLQYPNTYRNQLVRNPSFPLYWYANNGATTNNLVVSSASGAQFVEGPIRYLGPRFGVSRPSYSLGTAGTEYAIIALQNTTTYGGTANRSQMIWRLLSMASSTNGQGTIVVNVWLNPTFPASFTFTSVNTYSIMNKDITTVTTGPTSGTVIFNTVVSANSSAIVDMSDMNIYMNPGDVVAITAIPATNNTAVVIALNWSEDQ